MTVPAQMPQCEPVHQTISTTTKPDYPERSRCNKVDFGVPIKCRDGEMARWRDVEVLSEVPNASVQLRVDRSFWRDSNLCSGRLSSVDYEA